MVSKTQTPTKKPKKQTVKRQSNTATSTVSSSEKAVLITSAVLMALAIVLAAWFFYLTLPMLVMIIFDVLVLTDSIKNETNKRLILLFSILGALTALYVLWTYYSIATNGLST